MNKNTKPKKFFWPLIVSVLLTVVVYLFLNTQKTDTSLESAKPDGDTTSFDQETLKEDGANEFATYENDNYGFLVRYQKALNINELGSQGGYKEFIRFEQSSSLKYEGFAVGISELSLDKEVTRIKKSFQDDQNAQLIEETEVLFKEIPAVSLHYNPKENTEDKSALQERKVIILFKRPYTYSFSAVPKEIPNLEKNFEFI